MVVLKWNSKKRINDILLEMNETSPFNMLDIYSYNRLSFKLEEEGKNLLIWGENKTFMNFLIENYENKISMIYIDPPFTTGGDFKLKIYIGGLGKSFEDLAYNDKWKDGLDSYFNFIY